MKIQYGSFLILFSLNLKKLPIELVFKEKDKQLREQFTILVKL